jgi:hypothetical protein
MSGVRFFPAVVQTAIALCVLTTLPVAAQESQPSLTDVIVGAPVRVLPAAGAQVESPKAAPSGQLFPLHDQMPSRPAALLPLYGSLITLQGLDIHSTRRALDAGAGSESNPAMRPVVKNGAAFLAVKAGATASVIWVSEKVWKKNRKAAVILTAVVNAAMAAVVANNYRVSR